MSAPTSTVSPPVIADCAGCGAPMAQGNMIGLPSAFLKSQRGGETFYVGLCGRCETLRRIPGSQGNRITKEVWRRIGQKRFQRYVISEANLAKLGAAAMNDTTAFDTAVPF